MIGNMSLIFLETMEEAQIEADIEIYLVVLETMKAGQMVADMEIHSLEVVLLAIAYSCLHCRSYTKLYNIMRSFVVCSAATKILWLI